MPSTIPDTLDDLKPHLLALSSDDPRAVADSLAEIEKRIVRNIARPFCRRYHLDLDDTLQAVRRALIRSVRSYDPSRPAAPFLAVVTRHACIGELEHVRRRRDEPMRTSISLDNPQPTGESLDSHVHLVVGRADPDPALSELLTEFYTLLRVILSKREAQVWVSFNTGSLRESNYTVVGRELGLTPKQVDLALCRGRARIKQAIRASEIWATREGEDLAVTDADRLDQLVRYLRHLRELAAADAG